MEKYVILEQIGEGSFGKVYKARRRHSGLIVAIKVISKHGKTKKDISTLRGEIKILMQMNHENIVIMIDAFETEKSFCVVTEFARGKFKFKFTFCFFEFFEFIRGIIRYSTR